MKKFTILWLCLFVGIASAATQTINTVPSANSTFTADLQTFLQDEPPARSNNNPSQVMSGGIGATDASLAHTISAITAYVDGYYVYDAAVSHTYTASKDTFVLVRADDSATITVGGAAITYDGNFVFAEMANGSAQPKAPSGTMMLFEAVTNGTSITTVNDYRYGGTQFLSDSRFADGSTGKIADVVATLGALPVSLVLDSDDVLGANTTIPATMAIVAQKGNLISTTGYTLTCNGKFFGGPFQTFSGTGTVLLQGQTVLFADTFQENTTPGTTDMQAGFDGAVGALATNGGRILVDAVEYLVGSATAIDNDNITIQGVGKASKISSTQAGTPTFNMFVVTADNTVFKDLYFDINSVTTTSETAGYAVFINGAAAERDKLTIQDCWHDGGSGLLYGDLSNNITVENCKIAAVAAAGGSGAIRLTGCDDVTIRANKITGGTYCIQSGQGSDASSNNFRWNITGNKISGDYSVATLFYYLEQSSIESNHIVNTSVAAGDNWSGAITIQYGKNCRVIGNYAEGNDWFTPDNETQGHGAPIRLTDGPEDMIVANNEVKSTSTGGDGIYIGAVIEDHYYIVEGNTIWNGDGTADCNGIEIVAVGGEEANVVVSNNSIWGFYYGIHINPIGLGYDISNNVIRNTTANGMRLYVGSGQTVAAKVADNVIYDTGDDGIELVNADYCSVTGNIIIEPGAIGIFNDSGDYNVFDFNTIKDSTSHGIYIGGGDYCQVGKGNKIVNSTGTEIIVAGASSLLTTNAEETVTGTVTLLNYGLSLLDSSGGAVEATLPDGTIRGTRKMITMSDASTCSTISVTHHATSDPEVFDINAVAEYIIFEWTGTDWVTIHNNGVETDGC